MPHSNVIFSSTGESPDLGFRDWEIDSAAATSWTQRQEKMTIVLSAESFQDITNVDVFTRVQVLWKTRGLWLTQEAGREKKHTHTALLFHSDWQAGKRERHISKRAISWRTWVLSICLVRLSFHHHSPVWCELLHRMYLLYLLSKVHKRIVHFTPVICKCVNLDNEWARTYVMKVLPLSSK